MFLELLRNVAILLAFSMTYTLLFKSRDLSSLRRRVVVGLLFGFAASFAMLTPTTVFPGVLIDSRSIFISMAGLLGGGLAAGISVLIALVCRGLLGGEGAPVGYAIIVSSALLGVGYHYLRRNETEPANKQQLYVFGLVVHVDMMLLMLVLPADIRWHVIENIALPVLLIYPIGSVLLGRLLAVQDERAATEKALTDSEERLATILRTAPVGIGVVKERVFMEVNPRVCEMTGYSLNELVGQNVRMLYVDQEEFIRVGREKSSQIPLQGVGTVETRWRRKDGTVCDVLLSSTPLDLKNPSFGVTFTALDITKRKKVDRELKDSEARFKALHNATFGGIAIHEKGKIFECNQGLVEISGYCERELIGMDGLLLIDEASREEVMDHILSGYEKPYEVIGLRKNGEKYPLRIEARNIPYKGQEMRVVEFRDIAERKRAEEERERLIIAIEQSAEIVVITDADALIQYVNPAFEEVTGYSRDEVIGRNPRILQSGQHLPTFYKKMWNTLTGGSPWAGQLINKKKDGSVYTEAATISPVIDKRGTITNYVAAKYDISRELDLEGQLQQAKKMEAVGQMAGGIAHDFNNLLQVISGYAELSEMSISTDHELYPAIHEIEKAAERGKGLINQLLAFSRRQVIQPEDISLNDVVSSIQPMIHRIIQAQIEFKFIPDSTLNAVHADRGLMEQLLMNLCVNARDAMPDGGMLAIETKNIFIDQHYAQTHAWAKAGSYILLSVTDSGKGIDKKIIGHIFEPFFTTKEVGKGTGLGLSSVFGVIQQHNGHIDVYSEVGRGTVFKIYLPTIDRLPQESVSEKRAKVASGGSETVLIAEDDETILELTHHLLTGAGYTVLTAKDGQEAVQLFEEHVHEIDIVMFDVIMPRLGGKQALDRILELRPGLPHLFASGYSENAVHTNFIQKRGLHLLNKPYQSEELLRKIREVLDEQPRW